MSQTKNNQQAINHIKAIKAQHEAALLEKANVVGVGIGMRMRQGKPAAGPCIIVNVTHKVPREQLRPEDQIPEMLAGVDVWVKETGKVKAQ